MKEDITFAIHTLGCKLNTYESDAIAGAMKEAGFRETAFDGPADVYIINTCTVTNIADRKSRQMINRARRMNPDAVIAAAGCYVDSVRLRSDRGISGCGIPEGVDIAVQNSDKASLVSRIKALTEGRSYVPENGKLFVSELSGHTRAFIKIQDGCDQYCSYCIIPYVRGHSVKRPKEDIIKEVEGLSAKGVSEIVLTGINLSFLKDGLAEVIESVNEVEGISRIRLGSLEPELITVPFVERLSKSSKLCPHFHLSLQSGSEGVLKRMNRHYTPEEYLRCLEIIRDVYDHPAVTTDIIAGFPGETDEEFRETLDFVKTAGFYEAHIFKYSVREGTVAARRKDQIPEEVKKERSEILIKQAELQSHAFREYRLGKELEFLCEEEIDIGGERFLTGYTGEYVRCVSKGPFVRNALVRGTATEIRKEKNIDEYMLLV